MTQSKREPPQQVDVTVNLQKVEDPQGAANLFRTILESVRKARTRIMRERLDKHDDAA